MKTRKELLADAKRLLKRGWITGDWVVIKDGEGRRTGSWNPYMGMKKLQALLKSHPNPDCEVCAQGAVYLACALDGDTDTKRARSIIRSLDRQIPDNKFYGRQSVMNFNDDSGTTENKIEDVFDKTFARMKEK